MQNTMVVCRGMAVGGKKIRYREKKEKREGKKLHEKRGKIHKIASFWVMNSVRGKRVSKGEV